MTGDTSRVGGCVVVDNLLLMNISFMVVRLIVAVARFSGLFENAFDVNIDVGSFVNLLYRSGISSHNPRPL